MVGVPAAGTNAGTVGTALTDLQNPTHTAVVNHTHTVTITDPGHTHAIGSISDTDDAGAGINLLNRDGGTGQSSNSNTTGITASTANPAGGVASISLTDMGIAYWQGRLCQKN